MNANKLRLKHCVVGVLLASASAAAFAEDKATVLEEIVVTAQKRSENLQEVPVAISAYTSETRDLIGITTIQDLTNFTPGLSYSTALDRASIRGIGRQTNNLASDAGVATYLDGFYNTSTISAASSPLQVERIEILRGPQGTLYGRNSIGGTINIISRKPTSEFYGEARIAYQSYDRTVVEAAASGPLTDWLRVRFFGSDVNQQNGYFHSVNGGPNEGGVEHSHYVELQLAADFGSSVDFWLKAGMFGFSNAGRTSAFQGSYDYSKIPVGFLAPASAYGMLLPGSNFTEIGTRITSNPANVNIRDFAVNTPNTQVEPSGPTVVAQLTWRLPGVDVKYLGGYDKYQYHQISDFDGTAVSSYTIPCSTPGCTPVRYLSDSIFNYIEDKTYWSNEINVSSSGDGKFQWIGGLYQYSENYTQPVYFPNPNPPLLTPYNLGGVPAGLAAPNPSSWIYYIDQHMRTDSYAAFGQVDWRIFDAWKVTLGARYTEDKRQGNEYTRQLCYGLTPFFGCADLGVAGTAAVAADATTALINHGNPPGTTGVATVDAATGVWSRGLEGEWHATTGTAGVEWTPADDRMFYGKYSRGYKSGGFNAGVIAALPQTNPEYVDAFEIGTKITFAQQFQMNVAVFYNDYQGMQIPLSITPLSGPTQTQFFNMDVITQGVELETVWQATNHLQVLFNYAFLDTAIQSTCDKVNGGVCLVDNNDTQARDPQANQAGPIVPGSLGNPPSQSQSVHGQNVPQSPKNKLALNVNYRFDFAPGALTLSASDTWKDATYFSIFNRSYNLAPSYSQVDVRATWTEAANRYSIVGFVRNATNSRGYEGFNGVLVGNSYTIGGPQTVGENIALTPPRTYGVQVQFRVGGK